MKITFLGGAFSPPHYGHVLVAQQVLDFTDTEEVWFLPNFGQKYYGITPHKLVAPVEDRLAMTRLIEFPRARTSTLEIDNKLDGQTFHLLPHLPPGHEYSFIIGSDHLPRFCEWDRWRELLGAMRFLVFPRYGHPSDGLLLEGMQLVESDLLVQTNISSTIVRGRIRKGLSVDRLVPPQIDAYIKEHGLYKEGGSVDKERGNFV